MEVTYTKRMMKSANLNQDNKRKTELYYSSRDWFYADAQFLAEMRALSSRNLYLDQQ